jgi:PEP-CTERM motif-containing protein
MKKLQLAGAAVVCMLAMASGAHAASFTFNFDNIIVRSNDPAPPTLVPVAPVGQFTVSDDPTNPDWVDLHVVLFPGHDAVQEFLFNFTGFPLTAGYAFTLDDGRTIGKGFLQSITGPNQADVDAYNNHFDLDITVPDGAAQPKVKIYDAILKLQKTGNPDTNLDASMFNATDNNGLYAYIIPVSCNATECPPAGELDTFRYVATTVPEPATMFLGGLGLIAFGYAARRRLFGR